MAREWKQWEEVAAAEIFDRLPVRKKYDQWSVLPSGRVPVLDQSPDGVFGYHSDEPDIFASPESPIVTFSNHRCYVRLLTRPFSVIQNVFPLKAKTGIDPYFMFQALRRSVPVTEYKGHWSDFARMMVRIPPLPEQRVIAHILGTLDDKIEVNRRMNETLEAMARALFKSWFVEFDPVRAKAQGQTPPGMDPATAALFPSELQNSPLGEIPKGWRTSTLKDETTKIGSGATPRGGKSAYIEHGIALIRSQNVYDSQFVWNGLARITDDAGSKLDGVTVERDDVLLNITGASILRTCVVVPDVLPARVNQHVAIVRAKPGVPPRYLHFHLLNPRTKDYLMGMDAGASRQAVTKGHIESVPIVVPSEAVLSRFDELVRPLFSSVDLNNAQSRRLAEARDGLLPRLLSGELPVAQAEGAAEATV